MLPGAPSAPPGTVGPYQRFAAIAPELELGLVHGVEAHWVLVNKHLQPYAPPPPFWPAVRISECQANALLFAFGMPRPVPHLSLQPHGLTLPLLSEADNRKVSAR